MAVLSRNRWFMFLIENSSRFRSSLLIGFSANIVKSDFSTTYTYGFGAHKLLNFFIFAGDLFLRFIIYENILPT